MQPQRRPAIALLLGTTLALGACAGGGPSSAPSGPSNASPGADGTATATEYADTVCGALTAWITDLQAIDQGIPDNFKNAKQAKSTLSTAWGDASESTTTLVSTVQDSPPPDVTGGAAAHAAILGAFTKVQGIISDAVSQLEGLSTGNEAAFEANLRAIQASVAAAPNEASAGLSSITDTDLNSAFVTAPNCVTMTQTLTAATG